MARPDARKRGIECPPSEAHDLDREAYAHHIAYRARCARRPHRDPVPLVYSPPVGRVSYPGVQPPWEDADHPNYPSEATP